MKLAVLMVLLLICCACTLQPSTVTASQGTQDTNSVDSDVTLGPSTFSPSGSPSYSPGISPSVSDDEIIPAIIDPKNGGSVVTEEEQARVYRELREYFAKGLKVLKNLPWDTETLDATENQNIQTLRQGIESLEDGEVPIDTYYDIVPSEVIDSLSNYWGESIFYHTAEITKMTRFNADDEKSQIAGVTKDYYIIEAKFDEENILQIFVMDDNQIDSFFRVGRITTVFGWPVGVSADGFLQLCIPGISGG